MNVVRVCLIVAMVFGAAAFSTGCKKGDKGAATGSGSAKAVKSGAPAKAGASPKVGDSCKGIGSMDGKMSCDGNTKIFCSSMSQYKWKSLGDCKAPQKCVLGPKGKSVSCK